MIIKTFSFLTGALNASPIIAIASAFIWGILSILLSPCHLSSIPLIVGFISGQKQTSTKRAFALSLLFSIGILITIGIIGLITGLAGRMMGNIGQWGNITVAIIFFIVGLYLLDLIKLPFLNQWSQPKFQNKGLIASFVLGLLFGIALGPCTFAYMAPLLGIVFTVSHSQIVYGIILILFYALGHCTVIVLAGTFTEVVEKYLNWNETSKGTLMIKKVCGILVILGGVYLLLNI